MNEKRRTDEAVTRDENRDPITGAPGAHPVGTGIGAASGGAAGAAIGTALGGPIGGGIGVVAGAVIGGLAGKGVAEGVDPTAEDAYWRENYRNRHYVDRNASYDVYRPAYRVGYEGYARYKGRKYEDVETDLQRDYERTAGQGSLAWDKARYATQDAWQRLDQPTPAPSSKQDSGCGCSSS